MPQRLYKDEQIKLILLYMLHELETALDFQTLSEIIVWDGSINYFVFNECFNQLLENGSIEKVEDPNGKRELYAISQQGRTSIEAVEDTLLSFVKERIMRSATRLLAFKKDGTNISSAIEEKNGGYELCCEIKNNKFNLIELKMYVDNKEEAQILQTGFEQKAEQVYSSLLALLSGDPKFIL